MSSECIPHRPSTWPVDADGFESNLCEVCGTPTHYGSRHVQCAPGWVEPSPQTADQRAWAAYGKAWPEAMADTSSTMKMSLLQLASVALR